MSKVSVIGAGSWGTALALLLHTNHHEVTVWSIDHSEIKMLDEQREHKLKLPNIFLPDEMKFTTDLKEAMTEKDLIVLAVPSPFVRSTSKMMKEFARDGQVIVCVAKGIEEATLMTMSQVIEEEIPTAKVAVLSGPSHAEEVGRGLPTVVVAGSKEKEVADFVRDTFMNTVFRVYTNPDVLGIELGASLKNVIALAAGIADGLGCGDNTKAALITRGIAEITRLGVAIGGKAETFGGLSGIGDLIVTCQSQHSRNRKAGMLIGQGKTMEEAMDQVQMVVEGVYSAKAAKALADKYHVKMPLVDEINEVLFNGKKAESSLEALMHRDASEEYSGSCWV